MSFKRQKAAILAAMLAVGILAAPNPVKAEPTDEAYDSYRTEDTYGNYDSYEEDEILKEDLTVLFIGNSITYHEPVPGAWDAAWGMCASEPQKDFVHQTGRILNRSFSNTEYYLVKMANWECPTPGTARIDYLASIQRSLSVNPDVIVLELGENVLDDTTFAADFTFMIDSIKNTLPEVKLVMTGNTVSDWCSPNVEAIKRAIAYSYGIPYVDTTEIRDNPLYQAGLDYQFRGYDGQLHDVPNIGVAHHLNDDGMLWLAQNVAKEIVQLYRP